MASNIWSKTDNLRPFTYLDCSQLLTFKKEDRIDQESELVVHSNGYVVCMEVPRSGKPVGRTAQRSIWQRAGIDIGKMGNRKAFRTP